MPSSGTFAFKNNREHGQLTVRVAINVSEFICSKINPAVRRHLRLAAALPEDLAEDEAGGTAGTRRHTPGPPAEPEAQEKEAKVLERPTQVPPTCNKTHTFCWSHFFGFTSPIPHTFHA